VEPAPDPTLSLRGTSDALVIGRTMYPPLPERATMRTCDPTRPYLRVYEPLSAFQRRGGPVLGLNTPRSAASGPRAGGPPWTRSRLEGRLGRLIATPPDRGPRSGRAAHAYVRWADGVTYICPWQEPGCGPWLELARLRSTARPLLGHPRFAAGQADDAVAGLRLLAGPVVVAAGVHPVVYLGRCPPGWFVPFAPEERWLVLGGAGENRRAAGRPPPAATRTLNLRDPPMSQAPAGGSPAPSTPLRRN